MNILDLFSGIGGFSLAMQRAGIKIEKHYAAEIDKYANWIYRKQFPGAVRLGDVTKIGNEHGKIDIITGGFPCQSFSIAGNRGGFEDTRGTLFFEIERLSRFYKPSYMVLENVKGLFSHDGGNTIRIILDKLRGLNYSVQLLLLNTLDFGIPQNRERCFFICTLAGKRQPKISHIRETKAADNGLIELSKNQSQGYRVYDPDGCSCTLAGEAGGVGAKTGLYAIQRCFNDQYSKKIEQTGTLQASRIDKVPMVYSESGPGRTYQKRETIPPLRNHDGCSHDNVVCIAENQRSEIREINNSPALQASSSGRIGQGTPVVNDNTILRRLTPIECERLQDYPDGWTEIGINENGETVIISDTQQYKTLGNSITVKPAEKIMRAIKEVNN